MWNYEKRLQYPVKITKTDPRMAQVIISQFGGPDGELSASMRYLSQRYTMPNKVCQALLTDIGTEEYARGLYQSGPPDKPAALILQITFISHILFHFPQHKSIRRVS